MDFSSFFDYPQKDSPDDAAEYVFLPDWGDAEWSKLLAHMPTLLFRPGDVVIRAGDMERSLYLVVIGTMEVLLPRTRAGEYARIATIETGSVTGEQTFLDGKPRSAMIRALSESQAYQLSYDVFESFAAREPQLAREVLFDLGRILSLRLRRAVSQIY